ncbi:ABC transporter ATP-binding protein [Thermogladius sp.]|uniref:ABC transporter ATP-binding protein n=1 Tax=Thermogladius sp. TaxID=2023064 RepID=UPI003D0FB963
MKEVRLTGVTKTFGTTVAVDNITLEVRKGEFFTLLGPSGCGKTTTLRMIAGFEKPDKGTIYIGEQVVNDLPPEKRNVGFVFQNYALFPHMTVFDNIAFPLKLKRYSHEEIRRRVKELLALVKLEGMENRYPRQLSGGQQQRVALARALAREPDVLLLDEPLSNLDALLRIELRRELKNIQRKTGVTAIYVTHDQDEAFSLSDRIAVMNRGRIEVLGSPDDVFEDPRTVFVARFLRYKNIFEVKVGDGYIEMFGRKFETKSFNIPSTSGRLYVGVRPDVVVVSVTRPEKLESDKIVLEGKLVDKLFYGSDTEVYIDVEGTELITYVPTSFANSIKPGDKVFLTIGKRDIKFLVE